MLQVPQGLQAQQAQCLVQQDQPVQRGLQEPLVPQEPQALLVQQVQLVLQDQQGQLVQLELRVQQVQRVQVLRRCRIF